MTTQATTIEYFFKTAGEFMALMGQKYFWAGDTSLSLKALAQVYFSLDSTSQAKAQQAYESLIGEYARRSLLIALNSSVEEKAVTQ